MHVRRWQLSPRFDPETCDYADLADAARDHQAVVNEKALPVEPPTAGPWTAPLCGLLDANVKAVQDIVPNW